MSVEIPLTLLRLVSNRNTSLRWYYAVGVILNQLTPTKRGSAGAEMSRIAEEAFKDIKLMPTLYACRRFARVFRECELSQLDGLTWKHIQYLTSVSEKRLRARLIRRAKSERLTARELEMAIQERLGKRTNGGRKLQPDFLAPKAACRESTRRCDELRRRLPDWLQGVGDTQENPSDPERDSLVAATYKSLSALQRVIRNELRQFKQRPR